MCNWDRMQPYFITAVDHRIGYVVSNFQHKVHVQHRHVEDDRRCQLLNRTLHRARGGITMSKSAVRVGRYHRSKKLGLKDKIELQMGDSEKLLFGDNTFDTVIVSFGVRNFENLLKGLTDMCRVLKPGGTCLVVEFSKPASFPFKQFYWFYSTKILPIIGKLVSKDSSAYSYLPESVKAFPDGKAFLDVFEQAGFKETSVKTLTFGICSIYLGKK